MCREQELAKTVTSTIAGVTTLATNERTGCSWSGGGDLTITTGNTLREVLDEDSSWPCEVRREEECDGGSNSGCCAGASRVRREHEVNKRAEDVPMLQQMISYSKGVERNGQSEKSGPIAGKKSKANCRQIDQKKRKSRANCRQKFDREECLRAYPTAGTVWQEVKSAREREQDEDGRGCQSDAEGVPRRQC